MNPNAVLDLIQTQGIIFWAAAVAVALGLTLLLVAGLTQVWKLKLPLPRLKKLPGPPIFSRAKPAVAPATPEATVRKTENGYEATAPLTSFPPAAKAANPELVARLRQTADTLEEIRLRLQKDNFTPGFSKLKNEAESVEYLFQTTGV